MRRIIFDQKVRESEVINLYEGGWPSGILGHDGSFRTFSQYKQMLHVQGHNPITPDYPIDKLITYKSVANRKYVLVADPRTHVREISGKECGDVIKRLGFEGKVLCVYRIGHTRGRDYFVCPFCGKLHSHGFNAESFRTAACMSSCEGNDYYDAFYILRE